MLLMMNRSVLELTVGGLPFPHGGVNGEWRYRHAVGPEGPSGLDHQAVADFVAYESAHGRSVTVVADPALSDWETWSTPDVRLHPGAFAIQCCTPAFTQGCGAELVCHGAPAEVASTILADGALRAATMVTGHDASKLAAVSTWGEPPDYFDHVMLANGRCTAPEAVACSRLLGRDLMPSDLSPGYPPAVRFYFAWETLAARPDARFDGVHPVKIHGQLPLADLLVAVVVHAGQEHDVAAAVPSRLRDRLVVLTVEHPRPDEWASAAFNAANKLA
jgi:hypothetical protein